MVERIKRKWYDDFRSTDILKIAFRNEVNIKVKKQRYMNQKEACKYAGVSPKTLNKWIYHGLKIIQIYDGSRTYYDSQDIDEFLSSHKISI
jgi:hypothetical protein